MIRLRHAAAATATCAAATLRHAAALLRHCRLRHRLLPPLRLSFAATFDYAIFADDAYGDIAFLAAFAECRHRTHHHRFAFFFFL